MSLDWIRSTGPAPAATSAPHPTQGPARSKRKMTNRKEAVTCPKCKRLLAEVMHGN